MPVPSAPAYVKIKQKAQGINASPSGLGDLGTDSILIEVAAVAGATRYAVEYKIGSTPYVADSLIGGGAPLNQIVLPGPASGGFANPDTYGGLSPDVLTDVKGYAINASGNSTKVALTNGTASVNGVGGTGDSITMRASMYVTGTGQLTAPTPVSVEVNSFSLVTVTFDYSSALGKDHLIRAEIYASDGTTLITAVNAYAVRYRGSGLELAVPCSLAPATSYKLKMASQGHGSTSGSYYLLRDATVLDFTTTAYGFTPTAAHVVAGQEFSVTITTADPTGVLSATSLPAGLALSLKDGTDPQVLSGRIDERGTYYISLLETIGAAPLPFTFTLVVGDALSAPVEITGWKGDELMQIATYLGVGEVSNWFLTNAPPGLAVGTITITGVSGDVTAPNIVAIAGIPSVVGIFEAKLGAIAMVDGVPIFAEVDVRIVISGDLFLGWFHDDYDRRELQLLYRSREVKSFEATTSTTLILTRGDDETLYLIVRDGPMAGDDNGREVISDGFDEIRLVVRPAENLDAEPYLELGGVVGEDVTTEVIEGRTVFVFAFKVESDPLEEAFRVLNQAAGAEAQSVALAATGELSWKRAGRPRTAHALTVSLVQDNDR